jgi:hypothetical protein
MPTVSSSSLHVGHRALLMPTSLGPRTWGAILALNLSFLCIGLPSFDRLVHWDVRQDRSLTIALLLNFVAGLLDLCVFSVEREELSKIQLVDSLSKQD